MGNDWPFALFVLVKLRRRTIEGVVDAVTGMYAPPFWLATDKYDDIPKKKNPVEEGGSRPNGDGTVPPIPKDFQSPWIGSRLDDLVKWLKNKPEDADINEHHFAILDKGARDDPPTAVVCRIGGMDLKDDQLYLFRKPVVAAIDQLIGAPSDSWIEFTQHGEKNATIQYDET